VDVDWLNVTPDSGTTPESLLVTINTDSLTYGTYFGSIRIINLDLSDSSEAVTVTLEIVPPIPHSDDTVYFYNTNIAVGGNGIMPVYIKPIDGISGGYIPFGFDSTLARLDSITLNESVLPDYMQFHAGKINNGAGEISLYVTESFAGDSLISIGNYHIADIHITAFMDEAFNLVDTLSSDTSGIYIINQSYSKFIPEVVRGQLVIGNPTEVSELDENIFPGEYAITHNFPNPFNSLTRIELRLSHAEQVAVKIYNILGQEVCQLFEGYLPAGKNYFDWNTTLAEGGTAPSGVYFYRVQIRDQALVRKMILLK